MGPTPLFEALAAAAKEIRPALIVVDSIAATFGGNQNDRVHARTFVGLFRTLARDIGCAILLLDHPSLSGITSGTGRGGSMDWQNATRARLHLETVEGDDGATGRVLEVKKNQLRTLRREGPAAVGGGLFRHRGHRERAASGRSELHCRAAVPRMPRRGDHARPSRLPRQGARLRSERVC